MPPPFQYIPAWDLQALQTLSPEDTVVPGTFNNSHCPRSVGVSLPRPLAPAEQATFSFLNLPGVMRLPQQVAPLPLIPLLLPPPPLSPSSPSPLHPFHVYVPVTVRNTFSNLSCTMRLHKLNKRQNQIKSNQIKLKKNMNSPMTQSK